MVLVQVRLVPLVGLEALVLLHLDLALVPRDLEAIVLRHLDPALARRDLEALVLLVDYLQDSVHHQETAHSAKLPHHTRRAMDRELEMADLITVTVLGVKVHQQGLMRSAAIL